MAETLLGLIPSPVTARRGEGELVLAEARTLSLGDAALLPLVTRFRDTLRCLTGIELPVPRVEEAVSARPAVRIESGADGVRELAVPGGRRADDGDAGCESYALEVDREGVRVRAGEAEGVHRGLTSVVQLAGSGGGRVPCGRVLDAPRFAWRGLSLDVVRTFLPIDEVKRVIDMLSLYKMNVLHLHLTDDEGWRLEISSWPRLTEIGARGARNGRPGGYYSREEFRDLVAYARERFVTIVPEIDVPGHVGAALAAHPDLAHRPVAGPPTSFGSLAPGSDLVWRFVREVLTEGAYIHIGGDEAFGMTDDDHARFVSGAVRLVRELGKKAIGWQEAVRGDLGPDEIVQYWIDFAAEAAARDVSQFPADLAFLATMFAKATGDLPEAARKRTGVLLSPNAHAYLDRPHGDPSTDPSQEAGRGRLGLRSYPATSLEAFADWEPLDVAPGIDPSVIVGVEAALWCETVQDADDLEQLLLPRLPGVAEAGWAPPGGFSWERHRTGLARHAGMWRRADWGWYHAASVEWPPAP
ncbi:beta-N-acetylhexosaminidase [Actinomadura rugatobispora]|uniref:beta-N-acetylhexosaminidase n=1 Tax=Actinomadura rugatobispora TaxID=1994 RepID=A0ABW1A4H5_9ACTN|nr:family 20 glycosylhydrolase [Actinomadura rugatobispora]